LVFDIFFVQANFLEIYCNTTEKIGVAAIGNGRDCDKFSSYRPTVYRHLNSRARGVIN
jgi:hypothetical protein